MVTQRRLARYVNVPTHPDQFGLELPERRFRVHPVRCPYAPDGPELMTDTLIAETPGLNRPGVFVGGDTLLNPVVTVYALTETDGEIRYIGLTKKTPAHRLATHLKAIRTRRTAADTSISGSPTAGSTTGGRPGLSFWIPPTTTKTGPTWNGCGF